MVGRREYDSGASIGTSALTSETNTQTKDGDDGLLIASYAPTVAQKEGGTVPIRSLTADSVETTLNPDAAMVTNCTPTTAEKEGSMAPTHLVNAYPTVMTVNPDAVTVTPA
jgi:hypothetical protein